MMDDDDGMDDLFDPTRSARSTDVDTSHEAARSMKEAAGKQHRAIMTILRTWGRPLAAEQVGDALGYGCWRRFKELRAAGRIERFGTEKDKHVNRSGRKAWKHKPVRIFNVGGP